VKDRRTNRPAPRQSNIPLPLCVLHAGPAALAHSRALYGLDVMLVRTMTRSPDGLLRLHIEPVLLECNFGPDCHRACLFSRGHSFYNDVFEVLFAGRAHPESMVTIA